MSGSRKSGAWAEVFGPMAAEAFSTWSIARYIDTLAEAGKKVYDLPMVVNVWLGENGWQLRGELPLRRGGLIRPRPVESRRAPHRPDRA